MKRLPAYIAMGLVGLLMMSIGLLTLFTAGAQQSTRPMIPTLRAMLRQMPPEAVATELANMGYSIPPHIQATAVAMRNNGARIREVVEVILNNLEANPQDNPPPVIQPTQVPPQAPPIEATAMPTDVPVEPTAIPVVPIPTAVEIIPTADSQSPPVVAPEPTTVPLQVGSISGNVTLAILNNAQGITLLLHRPDGQTLNLPIGVNGAFLFANMDPGSYALEASAVGHLSARAEFALLAGQNMILSPAILTAGDTNGDNLIDLSDAALIAANFDSPATILAADLNHDGWVDVRDLALIGAEFGRNGPIGWQ
jgi:hypothetical protein